MTRRDSSAKRKFSRAVARRYTTLLNRGLAFARVLPVPKGLFWAVRFAVDKVVGNRFTVS
jgi:hypothetical protein